MTGDDEEQEPHEPLTPEVTRKQEQDKKPHCSPPLHLTAEEEELDQESKKNLTLNLISEEEQNQEPQCTDP